MSVWAAIAADFKTFPFFHQLREFERSAELKRRAILWQMRTGKSKLIVDTACWLRRIDEIAAVIVIAPNGVHSNWIDRELPAHHWDTVSFSALAWRTAIAGSKGEARVKAYERQSWKEQHEGFWVTVEAMLKDQDRLAWFALASETVTRKDVRNLVARIVRRKKGRILLVVDESDDFGAPGSKKTMMIRALARKVSHNRILTGTVVENSPLRAYSQYELLGERTLGFENYEEFKDEYAVYQTRKLRNGREFPELKEYRRLDDLKRRMAKHSSVVLRSDVSDMPDLVVVPRHIVLTDQQKAVYRDLIASTILEVGDQEISLGEYPPGLVKFQQIVSGYLVDEFGDEHTIPGGNPRLDALVDEVERTNGRTVVWCAFRRDMDQVVAALKATGRKVLTYHGRSTDAEKALARKEFAPDKLDSKYDDLVGHPKSGGRGLNLSGADKIIWYSHTTDAVVRFQADERATEVGGQNVPVVNFIAPGVDEYILDDILAPKAETAEDVARTGLKEVLARIEV
ncbi:helicase [Roseobacter phage RDJL Phi 1]|uniref:Helicase n=1 Tax=Roseobacter phage RDJL Phi 1 TaxID=562742 RepID=F4YXN3_9CAUD|nr:helicase [Roseobacter phage RDJL Phi 1]ADK73423.1 helicase [Roseobacter phage RDJL Phi 1]